MVEGNIPFPERADPVPNELHERFTPKEAPTFHLLRRCGDVRLWASTTTRHEAFGQTRPPATRYHVTAGENLRTFFMADMEDAIPNFEFHRESTSDVKAAVLQIPET